MPQDQSAAIPPEVFPMAHHVATSVRPRQVGNSGARAGVSPGDEAGGVGPPQHLFAQDVQDLFPNMENMDGEHTDALDEMNDQGAARGDDSGDGGDGDRCGGGGDIMRCPECCPNVPLEEVGTDPGEKPRPRTSASGRRAWRSRRTARRRRRRRH